MTTWVLKDYGYKYIVEATGDGYITRDICRLDGSTMSAFDQRANAKLIASAPDLLEFAEEVRRSGDTRLASMAIAMINKAKGN